MGGVDMHMHACEGKSNKSVGLWRNQGIYRSMRTKRVAIVHSFLYFYSFSSFPRTDDTHVLLSPRTIFDRLVYPRRCLCNVFAYKLCLCCAMYNCLVIVRINRVFDRESILDEIVVACKSRGLFYYFIYL